MSYNGSGTFNINTTGQPVVAGTVISSSAFNSLTSDLATGLSTAITKDGQTTTTARITFAQGLTSSLVTDSSSVSTGSIITAGGAGIAKNVYVGGTLNVTGATTLTNPVINNIKMGYTTTATAAGTTTLTVSSNYRQFFTGTTTQTIVLPVTSTLVTGIAYEIENNSTGTLTVNSSGGNLVGTVPAGVCAHAVCIGTTLTTAADWDWDYISTTTITGTGANVLGTSPTITSPTLVTPALGTPASGVMTNVTGINYDGYKNRIINGAMVINQRGYSATPTTDGTYTLDRWKVRLTQASKFSVAQGSTSGNALAAGFNNCLTVTSASAYSVLTGDFFGIQQDIEGYNISDLQFGTASGKTITLSFWVNSSLTGSFGGFLANVTPNQFYPFTYTISSANTWEQKSITIPASVTGTWNSTNGQGMQVEFSLGAGATYSGTASAWTGSAILQPTGSTSVVGTNGATWSVTGVQLEKGSTATSFDYRPYGTEFSLCQRYYETSFPYGSTIPSFTNGFVATVTSSNASTDAVGVRFAVTKRATPTCVTYNAVSGASGSAYRTSDAANATLSQLYVGATGIGYIQFAANANTYLFQYTASAEL